MSKQQTYESLVDRVETKATGEHVIFSAFVEDNPAYVLADGSIVFGTSDTTKRIAAHRGGALVACKADKGLVTGGDDGLVLRTFPGTTPECVADEKGRWIDAVAVSPSGSIAWTCGKKVSLRLKDGVRERALPSTSQGLAFAPKGLRLAAAHADGASLWFPNTDAPPEILSWKGSHLDVTFSPDGRFLVTSMQENQLHGWRLGDKGHMRMSGYPSKTRSWSWSHDGLWLATAGAEAAIVWPFAKDGPMGKAPRECGVRPARVSQVAFHPRALVLAVGYEDGWILLIRLVDGAEILVRSGGTGAISALAWDNLGSALAFGDVEGTTGLLTLPG